MYDSYKNMKDEDIILTSRIRIARNIEGKPFPQLLSRDQAQNLMDEVSSAIFDSNSVIADKFSLVRLKDIGNLERLSMVEKHLISMDLVNRYDKTGVLLSHDKTVSIMINEEDHIRLQVIYPGLKVREAYEYANKIDDLIEERLTYAFDNNLGYLTSCPTNLGSGIRASVMFHLPALTMTRNINSVVNAVSQVGMTIRGIYGEGSDAMGNIYQLSNQVTLGLSEEEIINNLLAVVSKIVVQERRARENLLEKQGLEIEDRVYRSLGTLRYARVLGASECLNLLSRVRMGIEMGILKDMEISGMNDLLVKVQPSTLQLIEGEELDSLARDVLRAKIVREALS
jgi:protein arginine kinase